MAHLDQSCSSDILFPEEEPHLAQDYPEFPQESYYSPPSNSTYSSYSHEVKYIFEPEYAQPRHTNYPPQVPEYTPPPDYNHYGSYGRPHTSDPYCPPVEQNSETQTPPYHARSATELILQRYRSLAARRRTWSPPTFTKAMGNGSLSTMRTCRSNDQLDMDADNGNYYEDLEPPGPPRLPPTSGILNKNSQNTLIRPIAFKPVLPPGARYVSTPRLHSQSHDMKQSNHSQDDGYVSQDYTHSRTHSHSTSNLSQVSLHMDSDRSISFTSEHSHKYADRPESFTSSSLSRVSSNHVDGFMHTPSPSDSGVGELEAMLRDKDAEIQHLRQTLEQNETAIFQVYEEKRQNWEIELKEIHEEWDNRVRQTQAKAFKVEQGLLLQLFKLQQERKTLRLEVETIRTEKEHVEMRKEDLEDEYRQVKSRLEEVQWDLCQKTGEVALLKSQLKDSKDDTNNKTNDLIGVKSQIKDIKFESEEKDREIERLKVELGKLQTEASLARGELESLRKIVKKEKCDRGVETDFGANLKTQVDTDQLYSELEKARTELELHRADFEKEREQWSDEKNKVIRYQKQLQLNYVQMFRKNRMLEGEMESLMMELENRDLKLISEKENLQSPEKESMC